MATRPLLIDISRRISSETAVYPGDDALQASPICQVGDAPCNITSLINWTTHFLTHVDPPRHFIADGATIDEVPLNRWVGKALVVQVQGDAVTAQDVPANIRDLNILFRTRNSSINPKAFDEGHVYVASDAVDSLIAGGANLVGIDYLSIDKFGDEEYPAHRGLLGAGVLILEGLDLSDVEPGEYTLFALPLRIAEADGSPVRAVLMNSTADR